MRIPAASFHSFPKTVSDLEHLIIFGIHNIFGERQPPGVVGNQRGQILFDHIFQTGAVAVQRYSTGRRTCVKERRNDAGNHDDCTHGILP